MNFKVGDKVCVKSYEEIEKTLDGNIIHYSYKGEKRILSFCEEMKSFCGNVYTILDISCNGNYELKNDEGNIWYFVDAWLEKITEEAAEEKPYYVFSFDDEVGNKSEKLKAILAQMEQLLTEARKIAEE